MADDTVLSVQAVDEAPSALTARQLRRVLSEASQAAQAGAVVLKPVYAAHKQQLAAAFARHRDGLASAQALSSATDSLLRVLAEECWSRQSMLPMPFAVLATGGYGRGVLAPYSDIDVAIVYDDAYHDATVTFAGAFLAALWDAGLKVSHALYTPHSYAATITLPVETVTCLLDSRCLTGDRALFAQVQSRLQAVVHHNCREYSDEKRREQQARWQQPANEAYRVQPDIKEGFGGQRDIQTLWWVARAHWQVRTWPDIVANGGLTMTDLQALQKARRFLWSLRWAMHGQRGKAQEVLGFDMQPDVAQQLGYRDRPPRYGHERMMRHLMHHARRLGEITSRFYSALDAATVTAVLPLWNLSSGFVCCGRSLRFGRDDTPGQWLALFVQCQRLNLRPHSSALTHIKTCLQAHEGDAADMRLPLLVEVLSGRNNPLPLLRDMADCGLLGKAVPDFAAVTGLMQYDLNHVYTVDEHTLQAIGWLYYLLSNGTMAELPAVERAAGHIRDRRVLMTAMLLHDIAKGRGGDHSQLGRDVARRVAPLLGFDSRETALIAWLVEQHLLLSFYAFRRDISDQDTLESLVARIGTLERLRLLFVLTVADIKATNPALLNTWKATLLRDVYLAAEQVLSGDALSEGRAQQANEAQEAYIRPAVPGNEQRQQLADTLPHAYWLSLPRPAQQRHMQLLETHLQQGSAVTVHPHQLASGKGTEFLIIAADETGLFARITGVFAEAGVNVRQARLFTLRSGIAMDSLIINSAQQAPLADDQAARLARKLRDALSDRKGSFPLPKERPLSDNPFRAADVSFDNETSGSSTILEVHTEVYHGLLYNICQTLQRLGIRIDRAKIDTFNTQAHDVFYVRNRYGVKLGEDLQKLVRKELGNIL